jgi:hypothetical protein
VFNQLDIVVAQQVGTYLKPTAALIRADDQGFGETLVKRTPEDDEVVDAALEDIGL